MKGQHTLHNVNHLAVHLYQHYNIKIITL